jgi:TolA-binding protein
VNILRLAALASCLTLLNGCFFFGKDEEKNIRKDDRIRGRYGPTLADLPAQSVPENAAAVPTPTVDQIEQSYRAALEVAQDPSIRHRILIRLADIEMARSEDEQIESVDQREYFSEAIGMYQELIELNRARQNDTDAPSNERLLYQLSKAYALDGKVDESNAMLSSLVTEFPASAFSAEAEFRRAELAFSNQQYEVAEKLYAKVMAVGDETPYSTNATYMHGWSLFKRGRHRASIASFTEVLDRTLIEGESFDSLSNSKRNLAKDTLRILSIVFSYLDGPETITEVYSNLGIRHYQFMLYANLGELYFEKDRFRDSADTYLHYVDHFPETDQAPAFSVKAIDVYSQGDFPSLILPAKEGFVTNYGAYSNFWKTREEERRKELRPFLKIYLVELSSYYHAEAQVLDQSLLEYKKLTSEGKKPKIKPETSQANYLKAAGYYGQFVATFTDDKQIAEMTFLQGEAYYSAGYLPESIESHETVAYTYIDTKRGPDAGYAAILTMSEIIAANKDKQREDEKTKAWADRKINSSISFSDYYPTDKRAVAVLTKAAKEIFDRNELERAITVAERLTQWVPVQSKELRVTAWLILSHSRFDLDKFAEAESAYNELLSMLDVSDSRRPEIIERVSASIYRQAEAQVVAGDRLGAVDRLLSLNSISPGSDIAISGQYDAANHLIELKDWARAEEVLLDFKSRYPAHELSATLLPKFALIYQESEQWGKAAGILGLMAQSGDPEMRRQSLYLSAELYEREGNLKRAIEQYRDYAHTYEEPFDLATEARFHLVEIYGKQGEEVKRNFWLNKLIVSDSKAGSSRTDRSRYLAAMASAKFAAEEYRRFSKIRLSLPIKKSMRKKKSAMDKTLGAYKKIIDYGIAEYVTEANHRIAMLYGQLSKDLMDSQRPKGLDELALEQYEILLEEQAYPFEEKAINLYKVNTVRTQEGLYDKWVKESFSELAKILPARYGKKETTVEVSNELE